MAEGNYLLGSSVDVSEVDAESPLVVRFFDEFDIGQQFRILHFSDRPCLEELADLLIYCFLSFRSETPSFCLDWFKGWADVKPVSHYCGVNPSHVLLFPREDILVLFQEVNKEMSEVFCYHGADVGKVFRVVV